MKSVLSILIFFALFISSTTFGQKVKKCDTTYDFVDKMPHYNNGINGLMNYLNNELIPVICSCMKRDGDLIASLHILLTIDKDGKVIDASFPTPNLTDQCKNDLKVKLLTMKGWKAGQLKGKNVCTHFDWPINCLKWD